LAETSVGVGGAEKHSMQWKGLRDNRETGDSTMLKLNGGRQQSLNQFVKSRGGWVDIGKWWRDDRVN